MEDITESWQKEGVDTCPDAFIGSDIVTFNDRRRHDSGMLKRLSRRDPRKRAKGLR